MGLIVNRDIQIIGKNKNVIIDGENLRNIFTLKAGSKLSLINITIQNSLNSAIYTQRDIKTGLTKILLIDSKFYNNNGKHSGGIIYIEDNGEKSINNFVFEN
ncbi:hypothetical protein ALNOE001_03960 [Candidatus Methanobinarius endosymbioticus]|uniref:Right handed beta helix domain-containing protein n=1 Tax=Candidatus Methanobinarius endosymbioticus TaxID=2006182 RepID=A0A366MEQ1_9EURY|nr:hypothetical protein ALNOE001_03960 [Candidatus Methanobinarius endosymbioticus]